jgi:hypothetical protein
MAKVFTHLSFQPTGQDFGVSKQVLQNVRQRDFQVRIQVCTQHPSIPKLQLAAYRLGALRGGGDVGHRCTDTGVAVKVKVS